MNQQYDVIVIGTGEKTRSTVRALSKQGQQVMYIELLPEMLTTMVCHRPKKNASSAEYKTTKERNQMNAKIHLQKQTVKTSAGETITYTFHVEESVEITEVERVEADDHLLDEWETQHPYLYQTTNHNQPKVEPFKLELVDDFLDSQQTPNSEIHENIYYEEESSANDQANESIFYEIDEEPIQKEDETIEFTEEIQPSHQEEVDEDFDENMIHSMNQTLKPSTLSQQKEREHELREKIIRRKGKSESANLLTGDYHVEESSEEQHENIQSIYNQKEEEIDRSAFLHSVLNKPSFSPRDSRLRKRLSFKPKIQQTSDNKEETNLPSPPAQQEQKNQIEKQKVYSFEPFSSRRRARAQKKNRMLTGIQQANPKPVSVKQEEKQHSTLLQEQMEQLESSESSQPYLDESSAKQPFVIESSSKQTTTDTQAMESSNHSNLPIEDDSFTDSLKKDDIEFEEPYGGYNSLDDFFPPYSNNRKRQEMDEIEKRKIALRGLHNLINNLG